MELDGSRGLWMVYVLDGGRECLRRYNLHLHSNRTRSLERSRLVADPTPDLCIIARGYVSDLSDTFIFHFLLFCFEAYSLEHLY